MVEMKLAACLVLVSGLALSIREDQQDPSKWAEILETTVIVKHKDRFIGWPTVTRTRNGELIAVFSGDRYSRVSPWGKIFMVRSPDQGRTWTEPEIIADTPLDDRAAGIVETESGTLILNFFASSLFSRRNPDVHLPEQVRKKWKEDSKKIDEGDKSVWEGNWIYRSDDGGKSWVPVARLIGRSPHGPVCLSDGRLLWVGVGEWKEVERAVRVYESATDGKLWRVLSTIPISGRESVDDYAAPHVVETSSGELVALFQYLPPGRRDQGFMRVSRSTDGGRSWTIPEPTHIWGSPPHLLRLENAWLLATYGWRAPTFSQRACISRDGGRSWEVDKEILLSTAPDDRMGNPSTVQLEDGSLFTVYYQADQPGEKPCLMATRWRLRENGFEGS